MRAVATIAGVMTLTAPFAIRAGMARVWAIHDGEKISADNQASPHRLANAAWDGRRVTVFGARNEVIALQVVVEPDDQGIRELSLRLPKITHERGGDVIVYAPPDTDPTRYAGRPIQIFSVNSMRVTAPSTARWIYRRGTEGVPPDATGLKPVQLVPENARRGRGGFPLHVAPGRNQAIWIEIWIDRNHRAGIYTGDVIVEADGQQQRLPLQLEVFDFALPDENSMAMMVFYGASQTERYHGRNLDAAYHRLAHRHRIELVHAYRPETVRAAIGRFSGSDFTAAQGYVGPGEGVGNRIIPATFYGPGRDFDEPKSAWPYADAWMQFLQANFPRVVTFVYMPDEPRPEAYPRIRALADNIHRNPGIGRHLPVLVTHQATSELDGAIDIWCSRTSGPKGYDIRHAEQERARGRKYWVYNGGRPEAGAIVIETPAADARMIPWACFKHGIDVYFYWYANHWRHNSQKRGPRDQNVWADPVTFDNRGEGRKGPEHEGFINGDGVLVYSGEDILHPDQDRGLPGPCSTLQLANFRRGLQDHQYLTLARKLGLTQLVNEVLQQTVPRVFSDADDGIGFAERGDAYERARHRLAKAIAAARN